MAAICKKGKTFTTTFLYGCTTDDSNSKNMPFQDICYIWKKQVIILKQLRSSRKDKKRERTPLQERPAANWQRHWWNISPSSIKLGWTKLEPLYCPLHSGAALPAGHADPGQNWRVQCGNDSGWWQKQKQMQTYSFLAPRCTPLRQRCISCS